MLDLFGIMFSSVTMVIIIVQAVRLDRIQPWFQAVERREKPVGLGTAPAWRRQG